MGMGLFKKKRRQLFGASIPPSCTYCAYNSGRDGSVACTAKGEFRDGGCKKYCYDPLMREPNPAPPVRKKEYSPEEFKL